MINVSEKVADSFRNNKRAQANPTNTVTAKRRGLYSKIMDATGSDPEQSYKYSMDILKRQKPKLSAYVMSKNEMPVDDLDGLVMQAYKIRCNEIDSTKNILGVTDQEANIFLEDDEADMIEANSPEADNFAGELFAPIGIAAAYMEGKRNPDNFVDPYVLSGAINTIGSKIDSAALKRAAQDKPAGVLGFLSGGSKEYDAIRKYLQNPANIAEKNAVIAGTITSAQQLKGFGGSIVPSGGVNVMAKDVIDEIARQKKREAINKALPFIIIGVIVLILVTVLIVKNAKRN